MTQQVTSLEKTVETLSFENKDLQRQIVQFQTKLNILQGRYRGYWLAVVWNEHEGGGRGGRWSAVGAGRPAHGPGQVRPLG